MANAAMSGGRDPRAFLRGLFDAAIAAAAPAETLARFLPPPPKGRTIVVGRRQGRGVDGRRARGGVARPARRARRHPLRPSRADARIEVVEAAHPTPDAAGAAAAARILERVKGLSADDLVLCLISGGGSALLALPAAGAHPRRQAGDQPRAAESGAGIAEMNCVRKHLSAIKGGRLAAAAAPARVVGLIVSDVPGDDPATIASGPTAPDPTTSADALAILRRYADRRAGARVRPSRKRGGRDAEARRSALRQSVERRRRRAAAVARRRRRRGALGRRNAARSRRRDRRRSARGRQGLRRHRAVGGAPRRAGARALRAASRAARRR